jgi:hydroxymethylbilane synthase
LARSQADPPKQVPPAGDRRQADDLSNKAFLLEALDAAELRNFRSTVSAPVFYKDSMLVLVTKSGAAAVVFTKEIEVELVAGTVDLAVHSMKDVPTELPEGLAIAANPERVDPRDAIVSGKGYTLETLPQGGTIGTSSLRRVAQVRNLRPDVMIVDVRGNLDTRMRKAEDGELDAVILAAAGITRMGWAERITHYIPTEQMVSAVGQGAIGIEIREDDEFMQGVCAQIADAATMTCVAAERVVMRTLEGGCQVPIGAYARIERDKLVMDAIVGSVDGTTIIRHHLEGDVNEPEALGAEMVEALRAQGAEAILAAIRDVNVTEERQVDSNLGT